MLEVLMSLGRTFWILAKWPLIIFASVLAFYFVLFFICVFYYRVFKGMKKPEGLHFRVKKRNIFLRLFYDWPKQMAKDYLRRNPEFFKYQGVIVFTGRQGKGKTIGLVEYTRRMQTEYPKCKVIGNLDYTEQDDELTHWKQLINYKNGIQGVVVQIDEMQNWFSSNMSKDFPPQMLEVVTQNRKNRRIILGTSQVFSRLSKPLREQCIEERSCHTFGGSLTVVIRKELYVDSEGNIEKKKYRGMYCFVQDDELRAMYDTYKVIESLQKSGFQPAVPDQSVNVVMDKKAIKKLK